MGDGPGRAEGAGLAPDAPGPEEDPTGREARSKGTRPGPSEPRLPAAKNPRRLGPSTVG